MYRFLFLGLLLASGIVSAADTISLNSTPATSDITINQYLSKIFGGLVGTAGGGSDPMGAAIAQLNGVVLIVGALLLAYGVVAGTMQTAHDGEVLGKRWSSMWMPIRTALGVGAIVPLGTGYAVIQHVMMGLVLFGVAAANTVWETYSNPNSGALAEMSLSHNMDKGNDLAAVVLMQELCKATINGEIALTAKAAEARGEAPIVAEAYQQVNVDMMGNTTGSTTEFTTGVCGTYDFNTQRITQTNVAALQSWFSTTVARVSFTSQMEAAHRTAFTGLQQDLSIVATNLYKQGDNQGVGTNQLALDYGTAVSNYNARMNTAVRAAFRSSVNANEVAQNAARDGWGMAGAWYMKYVYMQNELDKEITKYPTVSPPIDRDIPSSFKDKYAGMKSAATAILKKSTYSNEFGIKRQAVKDYEGEFHFRDYFNVGGLVGKHVLGSDKNPVLMMSDFGHALFNVAIVGELAVAKMAALTPTGGGMTVLGTGGNVQIGGWTAFFTAISPLMAAFFGAMIGSASVMAFYLPIAPFIIWFGVVLGWLVMVVEAVIAAPLWAVAHIHPDGDGVVGRGGAGYSLVLGLLMRPAFAVMGLIASMVLIVPVGTLFAKTYWTVFEISQDSSVGLIAGIAELSIFAVVMMSIINRVFSLAHVIPDQIMKWMGGSASDLGSYAGDLGGASAKNAAAIGAVAGGVGGNLLKGMQQNKQIALQQENNNTQAKKEQRESAVADTAQNQQMAAGFAAQEQAVNDRQAKGMSATGAVGMNKAEQAASAARQEAIGNAKAGFSPSERGQFNAAMASGTEAGAATANGMVEAKAKEQSLANMTDDQKKEHPHGMNLPEIGNAAAEKAYAGHISGEGLSGSALSTRKEMSEHPSTPKSYAAAKAVMSGGGTPDPVPNGGGGSSNPAKDSQISL